MQLNGTLWKGSRVRIEQARPDFAARLAQEQAATASDACTDIVEAASDSDTAQHEHDAEDDSIQSRRGGPMRLSLPGGQQFEVPLGATTGSKRRLFPLQPAAPLQEWACSHDTQSTHSQAMRRLNALWDTTEAKRMASMPPELPQRNDVQPVQGLEEVRFSTAAIALAAVRSRCWRNVSTMHVHHVWLCHSCEPGPRRFWHVLNVCRCPPALASKRSLPVTAMMRRW